MEVYPGEASLGGGSSETPGDQCSLPLHKPQPVDL